MRRIFDIAIAVSVCLLPAASVVRADAVTVGQSSNEGDNDDKKQETPADEPTPDETGVDGTAAGETTGEEAVTFSRMSPDRVRSELLQWLAAVGADSAVATGIAAMWADEASVAALSGEELVDLLVESFAEADPATKRLLEESWGAGPLVGVVYDGVRTMPVYANQVRLFHARWLIQHRYFDDALPLLQGLSPEDVVDPAGLLFYRAVCFAQLLNPGPALDDLTLLLNNTLDVPDRFRLTAEIMQQELQEQKDGGLNEVARLMKDVERRLDLGRSGEKTQEQEQAVIAAIDKLLEQMDQQNQQNSGGGNSSGSQQNQPGMQGADQSQIKGATGKGDADHKEVTETGKWGLLDDKAEAKARELIR
ncbi:MAG: hypothetical protein KDA89_22450, partial [Planctomycetaceae bacterium]|nr:hypothetical protein [Planctomycetaceae bacterium]